MKTYKYIQLACMVALMGAATGCADDALVEVNQSTEVSKEQRITIQASVGSSDSRVDFGDEVDNKISLTWQSDDMLKVVNPATKTIADFALTSGEGTASGVFEGTASFNDGDKLYAFYNNGMATTDITDEGNVVLTLKNQDGTLNENFQLMYGETTYKDGNMQEVSLSSLVTIMQVTIDTKVALKEVSIKDNGFCTDATLILGDNPKDAVNHSFEKGDLVFSGENKNGEVTIKGNFEPIDGKVTIFFYVLPCKRYTESVVMTPDVTPSLIKAIDVNDVEYVNSIDYQRTNTLGRGKMYRMKTGLFHLDDFENGDGSIENPFEIGTKEQLYSLMLRIRKGIPLDDGSNYMDKNYKLTNNIELDGSVQWVGMNMKDVTFDGSGYTISGPISTNFFSELFGVTVKDLVLNLNFEGEVHAGLALRSYGATIINCVNKSSFSTNKDLVGGLVADMITDSKMIGCANLGNITVNAENVQSVGGLVGNLSSGSTIEGCYSTGTVTVSATNGNVGTLVGKIEGSGDTGNSLMTACWSGIRGELVGLGTQEKCWTIVDSSDMLRCVKDMNVGLEAIGSIVRFDKVGIPMFGAVSGNVGGNNFGDGGEF